MYVGSLKSPHSFTRVTFEPYLGLSWSANIYPLLTKREVKMAGYWPSSFFGVFMDRDEVEVHKNAKKERGQYPAILTEQAWSIKDLLYGFIFKLELQQQNKTGRHETVLLGKKFFIAGRYKIYFQCIFGLACNDGKQGILNYLKVPIL